MDQKLSTILNKKKSLDNCGACPIEIQKKLHEWFKIELTYSNNSIEGNSLTRTEVASIINKGITVAGKSIKEHLDIINHSRAFDYVAYLSKKDKIDEYDFLNIHQIILKSNEYNDLAKNNNIISRSTGSLLVMPGTAKAMESVKLFIKKLNEIESPIEKAIYSHNELVKPDSFSDGNRMTARLIMNLILTRYGFPPIFIKPKDQILIDSSLPDNVISAIYNAIDRSLDIYLNAIDNKVIPISPTRESLIKIGELASLSDEAISTIRYWVKVGLLEVIDATESGYQLFTKEQVNLAQAIRQMQNQNLSLEEIRNQII